MSRSVGAANGSEARGNNRTALASFVSYQSTICRWVAGVDLATAKGAHGLRSFHAHGQSGKPRAVESPRPGHRTAAADAELAQRLAHLPVERDTAEHYRGY